MNTQRFRARAALARLYHYPVSRWRRRRFRPRRDFWYRPTLEILEDRTAASVVVGGDFNGDGFGDLAIGAPNEDVAAIVDAGAVNVIYGSATGTTTQKNQLWHEDRPGIREQAAAGDNFGFALAVGDFNGDGFDDLAISVPNKEVHSAKNPGGVHVLFGSLTGLKSTNNQFWSQDSPGTGHGSSNAEQLGWSLAAGDFNGDGFDDLACGVPNNNGGRNTPTTRSVLFAGIIQVFFGTASGLTAIEPDDRSLELLSKGMTGDPRERDRFGWSLAAGDFNGDGFDDIAIGIPQRDAGPNGQITDAGAVSIVYGSATGLKPRNKPGNQLWYQGNSGVTELGVFQTGDQAEAFDRFGETLAAGDLNGDGFDDLIVGIPFEDVLTGSVNVADAGAVNVIFGSPSGLKAAGNQFWHQNSAGIADAAEAGDNFGRSLAVGNFNGNGFNDLAIGVPGDGALAGAGLAAVLYGTASGLSAAGNQVWQQGAGGLGETAETGDRFGQAVAAGDFNGDGKADLAVAAPNEDVGSISDAGLTQIIYGSPTSLISATNQIWHQDSSDAFGAILDQAEAGDMWGSSLGGE